MSSHRAFPRRSRGSKTNGAILWRARRWSARSRQRRPFWGWSPVRNKVRSAPWHRVRDETAIGIIRAGVFERYLRLRSRGGAIPTNFRAIPLSQFKHSFSSAATIASDQQLTTLATRLEQSHGRHRHGRLSRRPLRCRRWFDCRFDCRLDHGRLTLWTNQQPDLYRTKKRPTT